jgi:hypothetical protein
MLRVHFAVFLAFVFACTDQTEPPPSIPANANEGISGGFGGQLRCRDGNGPLTILTGTQQRYDSRGTAVPNMRINAEAAIWKGMVNYPVVAGKVDGSTPGLCWSGGTMVSTLSPTTTQSIWHGVAAIISYSPNTVIENLRIAHTGDGVKLQDYASNWTYRGVRIEAAHDDCVENDRYYSGLIEDVYLVCYVFLSARQGSNQTLKRTGVHDTVTVRNAVIYHKPMPTVYTGLTPGTGPLFKWDKRGNHGPALLLAGTVIRVDQAASHGNVNFPVRTSCAAGSTNILVWRGTGQYPGTKPACVTITTSLAAWEGAVTAWQAAHP